VSNSVAADAEGRGSRPSPRWFPVLAVALVAVVVGLAVGTFLTYTDTPSVPLPVVEVPDEADVRALEARAEAEPTDHERWQDLGVAATAQAIATADPAWYAIAERALDTAAELDPDDPFTTLARGQLVLSLHDFDDALVLGHEITDELPSTADAWGILVDAQVELGQYDDAAESLQTMLDLRPDLPALARASYLRQLNGDLDGATVAMRQAETAGDSGGTGAGTTVTALLGDLLLHRGDLDGATQAYLRTPTAPAAAGLARIAMAQGDLRRAEQILTDLIQRAPVPEVVVAMAEVQTRRGDDAGLASTVELARTIAALQQDAGQTVDLELALFEASYGDPDTAVALAEEAYEARPDNIYAAGALAWALHQAGDDGRAEQLAQDATRLGTIDTPHELRMAAILGDGIDAVLARNPQAEQLYLP
jgi:tetratricopeptide (TPR) repeat protein